MTTREDIVRFLNDYLLIASVPDCSHNGLQVQGRDAVRKVVFGVSANLELFERAADAGADMIIVHHGLLWGKEQPLTGLFGRRVGFLFQKQISLLGYHLPLDKHPVIGHNALLLKTLQAQNIRPFALYHGQEIGFRGEVTPAALEPLVHTLESACGAKAFVLPFGPRTVRQVGAVSGGGWSMLGDAIDQKLDLFITGVLDEPVQELCREGHIHCVALGHYNSEKIGVLALMDLVRAQFGVETEFIDVQNPI
ncbi:Nif3-like dinuclear metal center hexameric protein [Candidatus Avelusimicrobium facis]|uniref:Nif3-like dinuclear metal center hexameric protein n=1 Tax=Candidatus Avelusimicrobium facis TaxID=3416203 RepID=UPI003D106B20